MPTLKGTEASMSYVQCFLYLVPSSTYVYIFVACGWILSGQTLPTTSGPAHRKHLWFPDPPSGGREV